MIDEQIDWLYITINVLLISFNDFDSILFIRYRFTKLYTNQNFVLLIFLSLSEGELEHNRFFFFLQYNKLIIMHVCFTRQSYKQLWTFDKWIDMRKHKNVHAVITTNTFTLMDSNGCLVLNSSTGNTRYLFVHKPKNSQETAPVAFYGN